MKCIIEIEVADEDVVIYHIEPETEDWGYILRMGGFPAEFARFVRSP